MAMFWSCTESRDGADGADTDRICIKEGRGILHPESEVMMSLFNVGGQQRPRHHSRPPAILS